MRAAWPDDAGLPFSFSSSDGVPGVQHALRRFAPSAGWTRHACFVVTSSSTRFPHASASTFLPVRAHVPFMPLTSAPIDFRRGDRSPVVVQRDLQKRSAGDADGVDFWASAPVCGPLTQRSFGRASDPALGFASCRVVGHVAVHRPGSTPIPITSLRSAGRTYPSPAIPIRSWTWRRSFPSHASVVISRGELPPWHVPRRVIAKY